MKFARLFLTMSALTTLLPAAPLRIGIAGLTHTHVHWLLGRAARGEVEIVGIAEPNRDLARRFLEQHQLPLSLVHPILATMIAQTKPEAVCVFGSIHEHLAVVDILDAARASAHTGPANPPALILRPDSCRRPGRDGFHPTDVTGWRGVSDRRHPNPDPATAPAGHC